MKQLLKKSKNSKALIRDIIEPSKIEVLPLERLGVQARPGHRGWPLCRGGGSVPAAGGWVEDTDGNGSTID